MRARFAGPGVGHAEVGQDIEDGAAVRVGVVEVAPLHHVVGADPGDVNQGWVDLECGKSCRSPLGVEAGD